MSLGRLRSLFFPAFLASVMILGSSFLLELRVGLVPCPLCETQRILLACFSTLCFCALLHDPHANGHRRYCLLTLGCAAIGAAVAARHVWLQGDPSVLIHCNEPPLPYSWFQALIAGTDCLSITWSFLDLTLPEWSLLAFLLLACLPLSGLLAYRFRSLGLG